MTSDDSKERLSSKRIVVKIGSSTIVDLAKKEIRKEWLESLVEDIIFLRERGQEVLIVSSGSVLLGGIYLGLHDEVGLSKRIELKQAAAATGQVVLGNSWQKVFRERQLMMGMLLLTISDTEERERHLNVRGALFEMLRREIIPLINENDTVVTERIRFGDNDRLAARIATMVGAGEMVIFSDVDGLYAGEPSKKGSYHIPVVEEVTPDVEVLAQGPRGEHSRGGMVSKVQAAKFCTEAGCSLLLASGQELNPIRGLINGAQHTLFLSNRGERNARKNWISSMVNYKGKISIDDGATIALQKGKSLLPSGVVSIEGEFQRGEPVGIFDRMSRLVAIGLSGYSHKEAEAIRGRQSSDIGEILGYSLSEEVIHRDDMTIMSHNTSRGDRRGIV